MAGVTDAAPPCGNSREFPSPGGSSAAGCAGVTLLDTCRATSAGPEPLLLWKLPSDLTENVRSEEETRGAQECTAGRGALGCLRWLTTLPRARSRLPSARPDPLWALLVKETIMTFLQGALPSCSRAVRLCDDARLRVSTKMQARTVAHRESEHEHAPAGAHADCYAAACGGSRGSAAMCCCWSAQCSAGWRVRTSLRYTRCTDLRLSHKAKQGFKQPAAALICVAVAPVAGNALRFGRQSKHQVPRLGRMRMPTSQAAHSTERNKLSQHCNC